MAQACAGFVLEAEFELRAHPPEVRVCEGSHVICCRASRSGWDKGRPKPERKSMWDGSSLEVVERESRRDKLS